jgi:hypothetical protein
MRREVAEAGLMVRRLLWLSAFGVRRSFGSSPGPGMSLTPLFRGGGRTLYSRRSQSRKSPYVADVAIDTSIKQTSSRKLILHINLWTLISRE